MNATDMSIYVMFGTGPAALHDLWKICTHRLKLGADHREQSVVAFNSRSSYGRKSHHGVDARH